MPRLMHLADVHIGARYRDLGPAAAAQRERQFAAFTRAIDLALAEKVDLVVIGGDLFDSNTQPRRSVEAVAGQLSRLARKHIPTVIIPGTHDCYEDGSIYRVFDLPALAGVDADSDLLVVLTDERSAVTYPALELTVHGRVFRTKRAPASPLAGFTAAEAGRGRWNVGLIHGSLRMPGKVESDDVLFTESEVAASGLDYLALGHWHSHLAGRAGGTTWAYAGAPEPVALDQDGAGSVLLVELAEGAAPSIEPRTVGRTVVKRLDLAADEIGTQDRLLARLTELADENLFLDARLVGMRPDELDLNLDEVERQLSGRFLRFRLRDQSLMALPEGELPSAETIPGAFLRDLEARIGEHESSGDLDGAAELREALRLGRVLLEDPVRVSLA
ncbi:MAG TPA: DNA repair exonuclease [Candidatus Limnocylindrales bacterium]|jgi:DNA repair protein SbcD/Mre11|nr:DNA repair exonuclease [Candidatus Limnocylindrales bacterium]